MIHPLARLALEWGNQQVWIAQTAQESIRQKTELKEGVGTLVNHNLVIYDIICLGYQIDTVCLCIFLTALSKCKTTPDGPQVEAPCVFPFIYKGKEYNECTFQKGDVKAWCSTKVDGNGKHVGGQRQWGYCEKECPVQGRVISVQDIICPVI